MLSLALMLLTASLGMRAQGQSTVTGRITDEDGNNVPGVFVCVKGTTTATSSDADGLYSIRVPKGADVLQYSMLGMKDQEIKIAGRQIIDVVMASDDNMLAETVVIGYGTMIRKEMTSSVASVSSEELVERASSFNVLQSMAGKLAGVAISSTSGRPGGTSFIRVRGKGSINASSDPLYVMDGVVDVDPDMINSADIESIDVLKDAAATAMYGAKGANGVVMITTKSGKKGQGTVTFNSTFGAGVITRTREMTTSQEYVDYLREAFAYSGSAMDYFTTPYENLFNYAKDANGAFLRDKAGLLIPTPKYDTDWQSQYYRTALIKDNNISFSNANDKTSIYASVGYKDMDGIIRYSGSKRLSGVINVKSKINDWLDVQFGANISSQDCDNSDGELDAGLGYDIMRRMLDMPSIIPYQFEDGSYGKLPDHILGSDRDSIEAYLEGEKKTSSSQYSMYSALANIHFNKHLTLTVKGDMQSNNSESDYSIKSGILGSTMTNGGSASITKSTTRKYSTEDYLTYDNAFAANRLKVNATLGVSYYYYDFNSAFAGSSKYFDSTFQHYQLQVGEVYTQPSSTYDKREMASGYFRTNLNWQGKYMLGLTMRADAASNLSQKWGFFPSASFAWVMSEEPWFSPAKDVIDLAKFRLSLGQVGNSSLDTYKTIAQYKTGKVVVGGSNVADVTLNNLGNSDLHWETTTQFDAGVDLSFWHGRVQMIADFYNKNTTDLLFNMQVPITTGYSTSATNLGKINNRGFELTINAHTIDNRDFKWDTDFIFSTNRTFSVDLNGETINPGSGQISREGQEWGLWYAYNRIGIWQLDEIEEAVKYGRHAGDYKYEDKNGDYLYTEEDRVIVGRATPRYEFTLVNTFSWKGLSLMIDLAAKTGFWVSNTQYDYEYGVESIASKLVLNAWSPNNQNTINAAVRSSSDFYGILSDTYPLFKGDFLRIRNVGLTYDFKRDVFKNSKFVKGLTLGVNGENLYVFTNNPNYDPEVAGLGINDGFFGWTTPNVYPKPLTVTGNIRITF